MTTLDNELRGLARTWQGEIEALDQGKKTDREAAGSMLWAIGPNSQELDLAITESDLYPDAYEIFDLAADLEWVNIPPGTYDEKWARLRELVDKLNKRL